jgi:hypothetical protein
MLGLADAQDGRVELRLERAVLGFEVEEWDFHGPRTLPHRPPVFRQPRLVTRDGCGAPVL